MACGACSRKRTARKEAYDIFAGQKYLTERQLNARLEVFKRKFCPNCDIRYDCNIQKYISCKKPPSQVNK